MAHLTCCPEALQWAALLRGQMSAEEVQALEQHLADCANCLQTVKGLRIEDTLEDALRSQATPSEEVLPEAVLRLMDRLQQVRPAFQPPGDMTTGALSNEAPAGSQSVEEMPDHTQEGFSFLAPAQGAGEIGRLGGYRVLKVLGQGGMGIVFQAQDVHLERLVALKAMKPSVAANKAAKQRFLREAKACAALKHDHVITIHQVGEDNGVPFIAMEFLEGLPLDEWLAKGRKATVPQILRIGREVAKGLAAAHDKGLIHRDIKPGNIWLDKESGRVKILDFGLARTQAENVNITQSGAIVGTPAYMAPEQARGEAVDGRCDLFSLGCVLYKLCTGHVPFTGDTTMAVLMSLALETPKPVHEVNPAIPLALSELIVKLLAKDAKDRPASAKEVIKAIQAIEGTISGSQTIATAPIAAPALPVANPFGDLTEAGSKLVVPPKSAPAKPKKAPASGGRPSPEKASPASPRGADAPRSPNRRRTLVAAALVLLVGGALLGGWLIIRDQNNKEIARVRVSDSPRTEYIPDSSPPTGPQKTPQLVPAAVHSSPYDDLNRADIPEEAAARLAKVPEVVAVFGTKNDAYGTAMLSLHLTRDGQKIFATNSDATMVWEVPSRKQVGSLNAGGPAALSQKGDIFTRYHGPKLGISVADADSLKERLKIGRAAGVYTSLALSPDGSHLAVALPKQSDVLVLSTATGETKFKVSAGQTVASHVLYSPEGKWLVTTSGEQAQVWAADNGTRVRVIDIPNLFRGCAPAFTPDGAAVAFPCVGFVFRIINIENGEERLQLRCPASNSTCIAFRPDGKEAAVSSANGKVTTYEAGTGRLTREITLPIAAQRLAYAPDGRHLVTGNGDGTIYVLRLAEPPATAPAEGDWVPLFNGKDRTGWAANSGKWTVLDGVLSSDADKTSLSFAHREFQGDFHLRAEVKVEEQATGGIWYRRPPGGSGNMAVIAGSKASQGKMGGIGDRAPTTEVAFTADEWITYEVIVQGNTIRVLVKGQETIKFTDPNPARGRIVLNQMTPKVSFRKVEIRELAPAQPPAASPFDAWKPEDLTAEAKKAIGEGDPTQAPKEVVAVIGESKPGNPVRSIDVSPDGRIMFATLGEAAVLRAWDSGSGKELDALRKDRTNASALSRDGTRLARSGALSGIVVTDLVSGEDLPLFGKPAVGRITALAINANGTRVASAVIQGKVNARDAVISVWDPSEGKELLAMPPEFGVVQGLIFSPDGTRLVSLGITAVKVWDAVSGKGLLTIQGGGDATPAISPDGKILALVLTDGLTLVDLETGTTQVSFKSAGKCQSIVFSPDGKQVACAHGNQMEVWDIASKKQLFRWQRSTPARSLAYAPDGRHLLTGTGDGTVYVLRLAAAPVVPPPLARSPFDQLERDRNVTPEALKFAEEGDPANAPQELVGVFGDSQEQDPAASLQVSPDGRRIYLATSSRIKVWDTATGKELEPLKRANLRGVSLSLDGKRLVSSTENALVISDAATGQDLLTFGKLPKGSYSAVAISPDGTRVVSANGAGNTAVLQVWDAIRGEAKFRLEGHTGPAHFLAFSPDGKRLATRTIEEVKIWDAETGEDRRTVVLAGSGVVDYTPAFSPDSSRLALKNGVYDAVSGDKLVTINHGSALRAIAFSPDGKHLAFAQGSQVGLYDSATGQELKRWKVRIGANTRLAYAPDGRHLLLGTNEGNVYVLRLPQGADKAAAPQSPSPDPE